jgi:hypothetical protein
MSASSVAFGWKGGWNRKAEALQEQQVSGKQMILKNLIDRPDPDIGDLSSSSNRKIPSPTGNEGLGQKAKPITCITCRAFTKKETEVIGMWQFEGWKPLQASAATRSRSRME